MADRVRWGILGAANIASWQFAPAVRASRRGTLAAVASRDIDKARRFASDHGVARAVEGYQSLIDDPEVDAIYICLPNSMHAEWMIRAAGAGKHVFCEKPLAVNAADAERAVAACERAGVVHVEAFVYRCHPQTKRIAHWLREGAIGQVRTVHAGFHFILPQEDRDTNVRTIGALGGGAIMDVGCYCVSWLRFAFGEEPAAATAVSVWDHGRGVETQTVGMLHFSAHRAGTFSSSLDAPGTVATRIAGTAGEIVVTAPYHPRGQIASTTLLRHRAEPEVHHDAADEPTFLPAVEHFHDCVLDGRPPLLTSRDAVGNMAAIDALLASARAGGETVRVATVGRGVAGS